MSAYLLPMLPLMLVALTCTICSINDATLPLAVVASPTSSPSSFPSSVAVGRVDGELQQRQGVWEVKAAAISTSGGVALRRNGDVDEAVTCSGGRKCRRSRRWQPGRH